MMETQSIMSSSDGEVQALTCWLCLGGPEAGELIIPCKCPSLFSHPACLARWQLQQAGREEERRCRFCMSSLPTWADSLLNDGHKVSASASKNAVPIMAVVFNNKMVKLPCIPGKEGAELFKKQVRKIFNLDENVNLDVTFELKVPTMEEAGSKVYLKGFHTFEAASTVAAICAAKRQTRKEELARGLRSASRSAVAPRRDMASPLISGNDIDRWPDQGAIIPSSSGLSGSPSGISGTGLESPRLWRQRSERGAVPRVSVEDSFSGVTDGGVSGTSSPSLMTKIKAFFSFGKKK